MLFRSVNPKLSSKCSHSVLGTHLQSHPVALFMAKAMSVSVSADGKNFFGVGNKVLSYDFTLTESTRFPASLSFPEVEATFVRLDLLSGGLCPKGYFNEGEQSRLAIDEIEIN